MSGWQVLATDPTNAHWRVLQHGELKANIWWTKRIDFPMVARVRIENGLNELHGPAQPPRCWAFGSEGTTGSWTIVHNGDLMGEWAWEVLPRCADQVWQGLVLAGLNYQSPGHRTISPPAPAAPAHFERAS